MGTARRTKPRGSRRGDDGRDLRRETGNSKVGFVVAYTGDLVAFRRVASDLVERHPAIHVLIHNAGLPTGKEDERPLSFDCGHWA